MEQEKEQNTEMQKLYEENIRVVHTDQVVRGRVMAVGKTDVVVDIGYKTEGLIPLSEFEEPSAVKVGDEFEVLVESIDDENGILGLSKNRASRLQGWERIVSQCQEGSIVNGRIARVVKGGLMVDLGGVEAFLPASQVAVKGFPNLQELVNQTMDFKILKINKPRRNIVVSRKELLQAAQEEVRTKFFDGLVIGSRVKGVVKNIRDFGAFIDLGGVDGLLHIGDMSWGRISHPSELLAVGDEVEVVILNFDKDAMRISLGLKQKSADPWSEVNLKYPSGSRIKGKVVNIMPYGAFVELEKGIEGLVHISELSWTKRYGNPSEVFAIGDVIEAVVLNVDKDNKKISLGIKQLEQDPYVEVETKYPVGSRVKGKIRNMTDYGAFVELEEGLDGLIHVSDISWTRKINHPSEVLKKAQKIEAVVLASSAAERKVSLGLRQLIPDPWPQIAKVYTVGKDIHGTITKVTHFGLFVELEKDLEGLLHISEIPIDPSQKVEDVYKPGDKIDVRVLRVDLEQRKLALTVKA